MLQATVSVDLELSRGRDSLQPLRNAEYPTPVTQAEWLWCQGI